MMSLQKQWKTMGKCRPPRNQTYIVRKVLLRAIKNVTLIELERCQKLWAFMSNFTITTQQIWSCHVALAKVENFYFSPSSALNFRKRYQILGKVAREQKSYRQKAKLVGGKHAPSPLPPPPPVLLIALKFIVKAAIRPTFCANWRVGSELVT